MHSSKLNFYDFYLVLYNNIVGVTRIEGVHAFSFYIRDVCASWVAPELGRGAVL
jgi:hypothetical protein